MKKDNIFLINFKRTLGVISAIVISCLILGLLVYSIFYFIHRPPNPLKPAKKVFAQNDKVKYGYETIQILETNKIQNSEKCYRTETKPEYENLVGITALFELRQKGIETSTRINENVFGMRVSVANSIKNKNKIYYTQGQFSLINKQDFNINENAPKPGKEGNTKTYLYCSEDFGEGRLDSNEGHSGWVYFRAGDEENLKDYYLIVNFFPGSPLLVFNLE